MWGFNFFCGKYGKKDKNQSVTTVQCFDGSCMPHCKKSFNWEDKED